MTATFYRTVTGNVASEVFARLVPRMIAKARRSGNWRMEVHPGK